MWLGVRSGRRHRSQGQGFGSCTLLHAWYLRVRGPPADRLALAPPSGNGTLKAKLIGTKLCVVPTAVVEEITCSMLEIDMDMDSLYLADENFIIICFRSLRKDPTK